MSMRTIIFAAAIVTSIQGGATAFAQQQFQTPEAATQAFLEAASKKEAGFLARFFGPGSESFFQSGNPEVDIARLNAFNEASATAYKLQVINADTRVLQVGTRGWSFPVPLTKTSTGWKFDLAAGKIELLDREIGENELSAIEVCRTYAAAQKEFYNLHSRDGDVPHYADRIVSSPGKRDGLYWPAEGLRDRSPLEGFLVDTILASQQAGTPQPYRGYYFRILKSQGPSASGGAFSYVINGRMIVGAALIAFPARWGSTGIMSFICNHRGQVFETDLGANTIAKARAITSFNPSNAWKRIQ